MEFVSTRFSSNLPLEYYGVTPPKGASVLWIALPFYSYKVFAPKPQPRKVNVFEKSVLRLLLAGNYPVEEIASFLQLDPDLIRLIFADLQNRRLVDSRNLVTQEGRKVVRDEDWLEDLSTKEFSTGFVIQNAWNLEFYPRFIPRKEVCPLVEDGEREFPRIELGTKGKPRIEVPFFMTQDFGQAPQSPKAEEILQVVRQHNAALRYGTEVHSAMQKGTPPKMEKVELLDENPEKVWIVTVLSIPEESTNPHGWQVADPFGIGGSIALQKLVQQIAENNSYLQGRLDTMSGQAQKRFSEQAKAVEETHVKKVRDSLTLYFGAFDLPESIRRTLWDFEYAWQREGPNVDKIGKLAFECQKLLETMLKEIRASYSDGYQGIWNLIPWRRSEFPDLHSVEDIYASLGGESPIPDLIGRVAGSNVKAWINRPDLGSLRPIAVASVLAASMNEAHPVRHIIQDSPDLFGFIERISRIRDAYSHGGESSDVPDLSAETMRSKVFEILKSYLKTS
jgi:hypothetical protein